MHITRRRFLQGVSVAGAAIRVGLPPMAAWFTTNGTAYAATGKGREPVRVMVSFNGKRCPSGNGFELSRLGFE